MKTTHASNRSQTHRKASWLSRWFLSFWLSLLSTFSAIPAVGAERIAFFYPPFGEFYIAVEDLEAFAERGTITDSLAFYTNRATPEQLKALRELLSRRFDVSAVTVAQFANSPIGEVVLKRLGRVLQADFDRNGFYPLRGALILAAADSEGLTVVNVLRQFPLDTIRLDLPLSLQVVEEISQLFEQGDLVTTALQQQAAATQTPIDPQSLPDITQTGSLAWRKETLRVDHPNRNTSFPVDLYLPNLPDGELAPLVIISHGVASDRQTFAYLAQHLASRGFAVAVPEHIGSSAGKFERFLAGFDTPPEPNTFVNRPLDVTYLLDALEARSHPLNLEQVGAIGQSMGGYTVLALAGATLHLDRLAPQCRQEQGEDLSFNLSLLLQCRATELPFATRTLQDERIKAVIALNPLSSAIFGKPGLSQVQRPLMVVAGSDDVFAPAIPEQIVPFTWLTTTNKYLVPVESGTHFSFIGEENQQGALPIPPELIGPNPELARAPLKALSTAFFKIYLTEQPEYRPYLSHAYLQQISQDPYQFTIVDSLTPAQLEQTLEETPDGD